MFSSQNSQVSNDAVFVEDVFSTWLYTANGSTGQTITNGIDLSGKGGLVWVKDRVQTYQHVLWDTARGTGVVIRSDSDLGNDTRTGSITYNNNGFRLNSAEGNESTDKTVSWTFRKQPKFFDVVTWSGTGGSRAISHALDSTPGCIIIKRTDSTDAWYVVHRSLPNGFSSYLTLNTTSASVNGSDVSAVGSSTFTVSNYYNTTGQTWVAYLFAHNAGGFGLTGTDNVISCGSFTDTSTGGVVDLGYEPQFVLVKSVDVAGSWFMLDTMRGWINDSASGSSGQDKYLFANSSGAEGNYQMGEPTATGFRFKDNASGTYIYIAIRRGPMKVPTSGTSVYNAIARTGTGATATITGVGFPPDLVSSRNRTSSFQNLTEDRLRGVTKRLMFDATDAEDTQADAITSLNMDGITVGSDGTGSINYAGGGDTYITWFMKRAPSFFDEVCYTGNGTAGRQITHNLGVAPELMLIKCRSSAYRWLVIKGTDSLNLSTTDAASSVGSAFATTSTYFTVSNGTNNNASGETYVNYLFATCAGVSKVGSYTGTGTTLQVNCGFTSGARFVLIKRTDSTGGWYVWDSARGIVSGNDPYLLLNSTSAEVTSTDYVDTYSAGFEISSTAPAAINASGGTFIFLAIA